jgi:vacuolar protein sorting-associated protein 13A/C
MLINRQYTFATLLLSTAAVTALLRPSTMQITGRLGGLALTNDSETNDVSPEFKQIMSIDGDNFAEFRYQTFGSQEDSQAKIQSSMYLNAGSVKFQFLDRPLHDIYLFAARLAKLKGLYDAATHVAVQRAPKREHMMFEISMKSPIFVFPSNTARSRDVLALRLGEINARNNFEEAVNKTTASVRGMQLSSTIYNDDKPFVLKIINDIDITSDIIQTEVDRTQDNDFPDTQVRTTCSDMIKF